MSDPPACTPDGEPNEEESDGPLLTAHEAVVKRKDRAALRRIEAAPPACKSDGECLEGSHCDQQTSTCRWECIADSDCGPEAGCTAFGVCVSVMRALAPASIVPASDNSSDACTQLSLNERLLALGTLNDDQIHCPNGDDDCPCGGYCNGVSAVCQVDCIAGQTDLPASIPGCDSGQQCTPLGRCAASSDTPPPPVQTLTLQIAPTLIIGNPISAPVLLPVTVSVTANSLDFVQPTHPATVRYRFRTQAGQPPPPSGSMPQVKCAEDGELDDFCDVSNWAFHVDSGSLVSDPKTIWIQLPQTATLTQWMLEGRSDLALAPITAVVRATPVSFPATDPGHYAGTMSWTNDGGTATNGQLSVPIEAFVTATNVALYEPSRILLPDGHAVLSRDTSKATLLGWLGSGSARYDVKLTLAFGGYDRTTGNLVGTGSYQTGSLRETALTLRLQRKDDTDIPSCQASGDCAVGSYCDSVMNLCLPGAGPPSGAGIVDAASAAPTMTLASSLISAWQGSLTALVSASPGLLGGSTPREQFERPYCYQSSTQGGPATFAYGTVIETPSDDLGCNIGSLDVPQNTFGLENSQQEVGQNSDGTTFNRLSDCIADLDTQPTNNPPTANKCASLSRFLLALLPAQSDDFGYRLKWQLLRQWLSVNSYTANTTVQDQQYEDVLGVNGQPPQTRLAQALDRLERGLGLLLDPNARSYYAPDGGVATEVARTPDYRFRPRPVARWTFNSSGTIVPNVESATGGMALTCNSPPVNSELNVPASSFSYGCTGSVGGVSQVVGAHNDFTIVVADLDLTGVFDLQNVEVLRQDSGFRIVGSSLNFSVPSGLGIEDSKGSVTFSNLPTMSKNSNPGGVGGFGLVAIVGSNGTYSLMQALPGQPVKVFAPTSVLNGGADLAPNGNISVGLISPMDFQFGLVLPIDELSLWNRALTLEGFTLMAARYNFTTTHESLPVIPSPLPGTEQAAGLPVHLLEAANADLNLLQAYVAAESNIVYSQCLAGSRDELGVVLGRTGQSLRLVSVIGDEAASVVAAAGTATSWYPRYQADLAQLAGRRADLVSKLAALQTSDCKNPLGISEGDLPLYVGSAGSSAAERFFAGSRFLANAALGEIDVAGGETGSDGLLAQARQAYNSARTSQFQEDQGAHDSSDRILKIKTDYEDQLKRYCGAPPGEDVAHGQFPLLQGFQNGTLTASNCYIKTQTENPDCANLANASVSDLPAECLRGEMGERVLAIQAAAIDAENASHAYDRAMDLFDSDTQYCARLQAQLCCDLDLLKAHQVHMWNLTLQKEAEAGDLVTRIESIGAALSKGIQNGFGELFSFAYSNVDAETIQEQDAYEREKQSRSGVEQVAACMQKADDEHFAIDAASDTIIRAAKQTQAAGLSLADDVNLVNALAAEGAGQLAIESTIDRTPPHLHYWLDQSISSYHAHMAYARRLTYLAVRAFEYESQQSSTLRADVLNAQLPNDLKVVASTILGATAPFAGRNIEDGPLVLSLRDDVLQLTDLSHNSSRVQGTAPLTPVEAFHELLTSDATKVYDQTGHYVGHGIRFSLRPQSVDGQTCAERVSRIVPSVTLENASQEITHTRLILAAANTFGSQVCGSPPGTLQMARIQPSQALVVGDAVPSFSDPSAFSTTGLFPFLNMARDTLRNLTFATDDPSAFAGRGRYGDYILIFPDDPQQCAPALCDGWSSDALTRVDDVLLRFDLVEQDNTHL